jgi:glycosyltransferase involved in cell wall biosynthesis
MLRTILSWPAAGLDELTRWRLARVGRSQRRRSQSPRCRALVTVCRSFPIYSQTFVYRELAELARSGFDLCLLYSKRGPRSHLDAEFETLWPARRRDNLNSWSGGPALRHYRRHMPEKVARLAGMIEDDSGIDRRSLFEHKHFRQAFAFARLVEAWAPDYLHSYFFYERSLMALVASYLLGIPRGITCYADHVLQDYELKLVPLSLKLADVVIATSDRVRGELLEIAPGLDPRSILVKPNAIASERFPVSERPDPAPGDPFHAVCASRIDPKKGLLEAVEAMAILRDRGVPVVLHLVGEGDDSPSSRAYERALRRRIEELDIGTRVRLEGRRDLDGVRSFLASAHLFVAPFVELADGDKDGIPTALLEAMAAGLASVVTDAGSILEVVEDGADGVVVPQRDPNALADAIEALVRDPARRLRLGAGAAVKIRRHFDIEAREKPFHDRLGRILRVRRGPDER